MWRYLGRAEVIAFIVILLIAALFRLYGIDKVPPAFFGDEANIALDAQSILQGNFYIITPHEGGEGSLWAYLLAFTFALFGSSVAAARGLAVVTGIAGVLGAYIFVRFLLRPVLTRHLATAVATMTGIYLAVATWHVNLSRIAFPQTLGVLVQVGCFALTWWALRTRRALPAIGAGLLLGLTAYSYVSFKLTPLVLLLFILSDSLIRWRRGDFLHTRFKSLLSIAGIGGVLYIPLFITYASGGLRAGTGQFTFLSPLINRGDPWGTLLRSALGNLAGFLPFVGQVGGVPVARGMDELSIIFFLVGVGVVLWRRQRPELLFLAVWWPVMLLPSIIAPEGPTPHLRRAIGTAVPAFALAGVGLVVPLAAITRRYPAWRYLAVGAGIVIGLLPARTLAHRTYVNYYLRKLDNEAAALINHSYDFELADVFVAEGDEKTAYILPVDSASGALFPESATLAFLYQDRGQADYGYIWDDQETLFAEVQPLLTGNRRIGIVRWKVTKHTGADPGHIFDYILEKWGSFDKRTQHKYFDIYYFVRDKSPLKIDPATLAPVNVSFAGQFALAGAAWGQRPAAGNSVWAELAWHKLNDAATDYQVALWLEDTSGHVVGRVDKPLLNNLRHRGTSEWLVGANERDYYLIPVDPVTLPGTYRLKAILYTLDQEAGYDQRLPPSLPGTGPDLAVILGEVTILPPAMPVDDTELAIPQPLVLDLEDGLRLLGIGPGFDASLRPGDRVTLALWWRALEQPVNNWAIAIELAQNDQTWPVAEAQPLGGRGYPPPNWQPETIVRTFADIQVPADMESGIYNLNMRLQPVDNSPAAESSPLVSTAVLGQVTISGRSRNFEIPSMTSRLGTNFAGQITLLGYDLALSGGTASVTLYWQARREMVTAYKVFVHLLDAEGTIVAQLDREPQAGQSPTTSWIRGEVVVDAMEISTPALASVQQVRVGLYDAVRGSRLVIAGTGRDSIILQVEERE